MDSNVGRGQQRKHNQEGIGESTTQRIVVKSEPVAFTTQETVDGYREKAMRIESVEQVEVGNITASGGLSLRKADEWNLKNHSHLTVARHVHEKTHPTLLVVTLREGEERGICSRRSDDLFRFRLGRLQRNTKIIRRRRDTALQAHTENIHAQTEDYWERLSRKGLCRC